MKREPRRVLLTGSNGLLGQKVTELLSQSQAYALHCSSHHPEPAVASDRIPYTRLDVADRKAVLRLVEEFQPDTVVNTAALTGVDHCETNREAAWKVNVTGVENLAHAAKLTGARIIQLSSDYVFDGKSGPYGEQDRPNPLSYYGRTKLAAENLLRSSTVDHAIVRTMVLYGRARRIKTNFALWVAGELREGRGIRVVTDQTGNPTLADDLAYGIVKILELRKSGIYHVAGPDIVSRYEFARRLAAVFGYDQKLIAPVKSADLKQTAPRPLKSGFVTLKAQVDLGLGMSGVDDGLTVLRNQLATIHQPVELPPN